MTQMNVSANLREAIAVGNERFMSAFRQGDAARLATFYTENGQLLPPNADIATGRGAIQAFWQAVLEMGIQEAKLESVEVSACGDVVVEVGRFTLYGAGQNMLDQGKYIVIWQQEGGQWKLHRDIFNSSLPPAGA